MLWKPCLESCWCSQHLFKIVFKHGPESLQNVRLMPRDSDKSHRTPFHWTIQEHKWPSMSHEFAMNISMNSLQLPYRFPIPHQVLAQDATLREELERFEVQSLFDHYPVIGTIWTGRPLLLQRLPGLPGDSIWVFLDVADCCSICVFYLFDLYCCDSNPRLDGRCSVLEVELRTYVSTNGHTCIACTGNMQDYCWIFLNQEALNGDLTFLSTQWSLMRSRTLRDELASSSNAHDQLEEDVAQFRLWEVAMLCFSRTF